MKKIRLTALSVISALCLTLGITLTANLNSAYADAETMPTLSVTKVMVSNNEDHMLLITAIKDYDDVYEVGYTFADEQEPSFMENRKYYSSITSGSKTLYPSDIFSETWASDENVGLIIWEIPFEIETAYGYKAYALVGERDENGYLVKPETEIRVTPESLTTKTFYELTFAVNEDGYGAVSKESLLVPGGTAVSSDANVLTIGGVNVTATEALDDAQYDYGFSGFDAPATITESTTITASFTRDIQEYTVTVLTSGNGSVDKATITEVPYGTNISVSGNVLTVGDETVEATVGGADTYVYAFDRWVKNTNSVEGDVTITAKFVANAINSQPAVNVGTLSWDTWDDADSYNVYYRNADEDYTNYTLLGNYTTTSANISSTATTVSAYLGEDKVNPKVYYKVYPVVDDEETLPYAYATTEQILIDTLADFTALAKSSASGYFYLAHDIDLGDHSLDGDGKTYGGTKYTTIASDSNKTFGGLSSAVSVLDGNGYGFKNFMVTDGKAIDNSKTATVDEGNFSNNSLFRIVGAYGTVKNLFIDGLTDEFCTGGNSIYKLAFTPSNAGTIENVVIKLGAYCLPGFAGIARKNLATGTIRNCVVDTFDNIKRYNSGYVDTPSYNGAPSNSVSSFISMRNTGTIENCYAYSRGGTRFWYGITAAPFTTAGPNFNLYGLAFNTSSDVSTGTMTDCAWYSGNTVEILTNDGVKTRSEFATELDTQVSAGKLSQTAYNMYDAIA